MSLDLNSLLKDWPHEPGSIKVRKITGLDGREKLQLRIDLGRAADGDDRPSRRPAPAQLRVACSSIINVARNVPESAARPIELTPEQCTELQQEGIQYYHRYLSLFQINDFPRVIRDTQRNLDLFNFVAEPHRSRGSGLELPAISSLRADDEHAGQSFASFSVKENLPTPCARSSRGATPFRSFSSNRISPSSRKKVPSSRFWRNGCEEVSSKRPLSKLEIMQREMETAIAKELYERAAELRDAIKLLKAGK